MSPRFERYSQSDVSFWGIMAIACVAVGVGGVALSGFIPENVVAGLHATRLEGGTLNALRAEVGGLRTRIDRVVAENDRLTTQISLAEQDQGSVTQRVAALENSLPVLLEQLPNNPGVDLGAVTASTETNENLRPVEGGSVSVSTSPLFPNQAMPAKPAEQTSKDTKAIKEASRARPNLTAIGANGFGVSLGPPLAIEDAAAAWRQTHDKVGALLLGMTPALANAEGGKFRLVAGPLDNVQSAQQLCTRLVRSGVGCRPVSYSGYALPQ